jgi:hypothetical protein
MRQDLKHEVKGGNLNEQQHSDSEQKMLQNTSGLGNSLYFQQLQKI